MAKEIVKNWRELGHLLDDIHEARTYFDTFEYDTGKYSGMGASFQLRDADGKHVRFPIQLTADVTFHE